jgi:GT2 family glycosyltransferase
MSEKRPVSVVIPNYNGAHLLRQNLPSVLQALAWYCGKRREDMDAQNTESSRLQQVIVIDDASADRSIEVLTEEFPSVEIVRHPQNLGYSQAVFSGVQAANNDIVILLNSDVSPREDFLAHLLDPFAEPGVFAVSPLVYDEHGEPLQASWNRAELKKGRLMTRKWAPSELAQATGSATRLCHLFASGGSMALRRAGFLELGGFLDIYRPFYYEDMDLGVRAWRKGWQVVFEPRSVVVHPQGSTINRFYKRWRVKAVMQRNRLLLQWIHLPPKVLITAHLPRLFIRYLEHALRLDGVAWLGLFWAFAKLPEVFAARRKMKAPGWWNLHEALRPMPGLTGGPDKGSASK